MKKKIVIGISILIGITLIISTFILKKKNNNYQSYNNSGSHLAFYYQDDTGKYVPSTESKWTDSTYILNLEQSSCNGKKNPEYLSWDSDNHMVMLSNGISTSCTLYFDKRKPNIFEKCPETNNLVECITKLDGEPSGEESITSNLCPSGIGGIIKHDGSNTNDAGDNSLRFSGCNPNNYICLGIGSEGYNRGEEDSCPIENKYRIIGIVPVTVGDTTQNLVKVIKAEYLTEIEFGDKDGTATSSSTYNNLRRAEGSSTGIPAYKWNTSSNNNWEGSTLNASLNSEKYLNDAFGNTWINIIESVNWDIAGSSSYSIPVKTMYQAETTKKQTAPSQIGLMNAYDYGYASSSNNWKFNLYDYHNSGSGNNNRENNWLYNGTYEWTISPHTSGSTKAFYIVDTGRLSSLATTSTFAAVRPVFYLKEGTKIYGDSTITGTVDKPFKLDVPKESDKPVEPDFSKFNNIFDLCPGNTNLINCFQNLDISASEDTNITSLCPDGIGEIVKHNGTVANDAGDGGIRYSGCNPNNYICFGAGSEGYNNGQQNTCPLENKYRIIGYVPVEVDGARHFRVKVIKAEYLTEDEFEEKDGSTSFESSYKPLKKVETTQSSIAGYHWNDIDQNAWKDSSLYKSLNSEYVTKSLGDWLSKIETVKWNVGGSTSSRITAQAMRQQETGITTGGSVTVKGEDSLIGLMYNYDYGFASSSNNWQTELYYYGNAQNRVNNWLFNGVTEWTISRRSNGNSDYYGHVNIIIDDGGVFDAEQANKGIAGVRPAFYLKSDTQITGDSTYNGSPLHPFKVN